MGLTHRSKTGKVEVQTTSTPTVDQWNQVAAQVDMESGKVRVFQNGSLVHEEIYTAGIPPQLAGEDWFIGMGELSYAIDETRFSSTARSQTWINASYDNQKAAPDFPNFDGAVNGSHSFISKSNFVINAEKYFSHQVEATGSPQAYIASGLPPGLVLDPNPIDGNLSGTPSQAGYYNSQVIALYADGSQASQNYEFTVIAGSPVVSISSPQSISGIPNALELDYEVTATGGDDPLVFVVADTIDHGKELYKWKYRFELGELGLGPGTTILNGLNSDATFYVRMYAVNSVGDFWTGKDSRVRLQPKTHHSLWD